MMYSPKAALLCPSDFNFPFTPYTIQQQLMQELYQVVENKQIGVFESPTGTGKSLTLTCSALKWLEDHEQLVRKELQCRLEEVQQELFKLEKDSQEALDWVSMHSKASHQRQDLLELKTLKKLLDEFEEKINEIKNKRKSIKQTHSRRNKMEMNEEDNILDIQDELNISIEDSNLAQSDESFDFGAKQEKYRDVQIFFCSRTHTQLAQVVREIKRTVYGERVRCVSLASRQQFCIHKQLRNLNNTALINEKCLDMTKGTKMGAKTTSCDTDSCILKKAKVIPKSGLNAMNKCEFKNQEMVQALTEISLVDILDVEDLVAEGEQLQACPYYAARNATQLAQIVMLPYQILLHKRTRQQNGIDLKGSIVIIDEAHNLLDTISQMHSCELSLQQLIASHQQILAYKMRYASRFNSSNLLSINQLLFVIKRLTKILKSCTKDTTKSSCFRMLCTYELMSEGDFFNIDLYKLVNFCENSRFAQKLQGFAKSLSVHRNSNENQAPACSKSAAKNLLERLQKDHTEKHQKSSESKLEELNINNDIQKTVRDKTFNLSTSPIRPLISFLEALCEKADDGRILVNIAEESAENYELHTAFKYILLNPGAHFQDVVNEARAIIVAGGTMQPTAELTEQLFNSCPERVQLRFYDHVVPDDAVLPFVVTKSPSGKNLCFNFAQRSSKDMLSDLCTVLENLCNVVPAGLICFLPSYDYLDTVHTHLQKSGALQRISLKKRTFKEPRNITNNNDFGNNRECNQTAEQLLNDYAKAIKHNQGGALLFSVVGGKLSEGLNFADGLGRGVIVVGMPYPNRKSPELQERMSYLDSTLGTGSGSEYYENLCMKAVNQCIGRSVRHIRDYACVYLLDERYARGNIKRKLPQWISRHLQIATTYGQVQGGTAKFFRQKKV